MRKLLASLFDWHELAFHLGWLLLGGSLMLLEIPLGLLLAASGAPLPSPKPKEKLTRDILIGRWNVSWLRSPCTMHFYPDGSYESEFGAVGQGPLYEGVWKLEGTTLTIQEVFRGNPSSTAATYVLLLRPRHHPNGKLDRSQLGVARVTGFSAEAVILLSRPGGRDLPERVPLPSAVPLQ